MPRPDSDESGRRRRRRDDYDDDSDDRPRRSKESGGMSVLLILGIVGGVLLLVCGGLGVLLLLPAVTKVREAAGRQRDANNLKQIGLGVHNQFAGTNRFATGPHFSDPNTGQVNTGLSWRVGILPYIEQESLYRQFNTTQPWDGPTNRPLGNTVVITYTSPLDPKGTAATRYRGFVGPGTLMEPGKTIKLTEIPDGTANTILCITADDGVVWSKPDELPYSPTGPLPSFGKRAFPNGTNVLMADGSVRFLRADTPEHVVRAMITRNGGEVVPLP